MNFQEAESYLYSLGNEVETMKLGLENITTLLAALGDPQNRYKKVQVAGTNGKGSVCAFLDSICREAGIRTGLYTSPHLVSVTERVKIDGADIHEEGFARIATLIRDASESLVREGKLERVPTFFEQVTALALLAFAEHNVQLAILETGLGGRYDAVTSANAEIAAITRIDLDHQEYLGETIEEIAAEKAAIVREDSSVVIGGQSEPAMKVVLDHCRTLGVVPNFEVYNPWTVAASGPETVTVETTRFIYPNVKLGLKGDHQIENGEVAINVVQSLKYDLGFQIDDSEAIVPGLENARHPGRLELIGRFLLDGAHNPSGARALASYLDEFFRDRTVTIIFGAMKDKDLGEISATLFPLAEQLILTQANNSRSASIDGLLKLAGGKGNVFCAGNIGEALEIAGKFPDDLVCITGSLYLVGEARKILLQL